MKKLKNWLINKCGGYTFDEYEEMRNTYAHQNQVLKNRLNTSLPHMAISRNLITLRACRIVPCLDGDWEYYMRQEVAQDFSNILYENDLIDWDLTETPEGIKLTGTLYVARRQ